MQSELVVDVDVNVNVMLLMENMLLPMSIFRFYSMLFNSVIVVSHRFVNILTTKHKNIITNWIEAQSKHLLKS